MRYIMFSPQGIHYESQDAGEAQALFVPFADQVRRLENLPDPSRAKVAERYGAGTRIPLWVSSVGGTWCYGTLDPQLAERRHAMGVYLPQDFAPENCDVFYYVLGRDWIVHGIRVVSDEGYVDWRVSKMQAVDTTVVDELLGSISNRMVTGTQDQVLVAVLGEQDLFQDIKSALEPLNLDVTRFEALSPRKSQKPLYKHGDYGLMMLTVATFAALTLLAVTTLFLLNSRESEQLKQEVRRTQVQISRIQLNENLNVKAPRVVLAAIEKPYNFQMADLIQQVGESVESLGTVAKINVGNAGRDRFERRSGNNKVVDVVVELENVDEALLVAQEQVAARLLIDRPWLRRIERIDNATSQRGGNMTLRLEVLVP